MDWIQIFQISGVLLLVSSVMVYSIYKDIMVACMCLIVAVFVLLGAFYYQDQNNSPSRYISKDEVRAAKMFNENCKQVNFVQANNTSGVGIGLTTKGSPVVGTMSSSNEDSYVYACDENIQYTLTYDIEKYRKFYK